MNFFKEIYYKKYTKTSYSLSNVDLVINRIFSKKKNGIYIDIGCNHPIKYNNTHLLHKKGWRGINIDLDEKSILEFNKIRKSDYNKQALISNVSGKIKEIYFYHSRSAINTVSKELTDSRKNKPKKIKKEKSTTINEIINNSPYKNEKINFMSIDIEDHEYEALKNFDFNKYKIDIICVECNDKSQKELEIYNQDIEFVKNSKIYTLLTNNNYKLINWVNADLIFARRDFK
jgi:hypothetical protein